MVAPRFTPAATTPCKCGAKLRIYADDLRPEACARCGAAPVVATTLAPGLAKEVQLAEALNAAGLFGWEAQWPWGMLLSPARRFVADFGYPKQRVIVESVGRAHAAGVEKVYKDAERSALAASIGILVVPLHPGMINDGTGVELVRAALARGTP